MKLALQTDYALRTLLYLTVRPGRATVASVATFYGISLHHLGKVVQQLGRLGLVQNRRGPGGGIELAGAPERITVGAVVRAFEGRGIHLLDCADTPGFCRIQPGCTLRHVLIEAERRQMEYLDSVTLADLSPSAGGVEALLPILAP